jgi:hypothetical protein
MLFFACTDEVHQDWDHGSVHRHRHRRRIERNSFEESLHDFDRIDGDTGLTHICGHSRMIAVVAAMSCKIEGDRYALLTSSERPSIESIGGFRRGEAGVLTDGPWPARIHGRTRTPYKRLEAWPRTQVLDTLKVRGRVDGLNRDAPCCARSGHRSWT